MEKEQKKLLLVAVSVGVFLLVTITAAMVMLTPKMQTQENSFISSVPFRPGNVQTTETSGNNSFQPIDNNLQETNTVIPENPIVIEKTSNNGYNSNSSNNGNNINNGNNDLIVQIPRPTSVVLNSPEISTSTVTNPAAVKQTTPATTVSTPAATTPKPTAKTSTAAKPSSTAKTINDYWIQTGAYLALVRAEDAKDLLASNGLTSIIENRMVEGKLYYRVRLGPYTSEREANYWLTLVKSIEGFGESQVRQTARQL